MAKREELPAGVWGWLDLGDVEAWTGGGTKVPVGKYRLRVDRGEYQDDQGKIKVVMVHTILAGPNDTDECKGRQYDEWFDMGKDAKGKFRGFVEAVVPKGLHDCYLQTMQNGAKAPIADLYIGAIYDCFIDLRGYNTEKGEKREMSQITLNTIQLQQASPTAEQWLRQRQAQAQQAQAPSGPPAGGPSNGSNAPQPPLSGPPNYNQPVR